jgi:hypothetical protein
MALIFMLVNVSFAQGQAQPPAQGPAVQPPAQGPAVQAPNQGPDRVCIGDICANSGRYNLGCDFAYAHPADTDEQAAKYVCEFLNNFSQYKFIRVGTAPGGKCGVIYLDVKCQ